MTHTVTLGGREFAITPTDAADFAALHGPLARLLADAGVSAPTAADYGNAIRAPAGAAVLIHHKLRQADPTVTAEWVAEHVRTAADAQAVYAVLAAANGLTPEDPAHGNG